MPNEVTQNGMFYLPATRRVVPVSCRYQIYYERHYHVYRLVSIEQQPVNG